MNETLTPPHTHNKAQDKIKVILSKGYLNSNTVLCLDLLASAIASLAAILLTNVFFPPTGITTTTLSWWLASSLVFSWLFFKAFKTQRSVIRYSTLHSTSKIAIAELCKYSAMALLLYALPSIELSPRVWGTLVLDLLLSFAMLVMMRVVMIGIYNRYRSRHGDKSHCARLLVYGSDDMSVAMITALAASPLYKAAGFIHFDEKRLLKNYKISDYPITGFKDLHDIEKVKKNLQIDAILFASEADVQLEQDRLIVWCISCGIKTLIAPSIDEMVDGHLKPQDIREVKVEDLLGREEIRISVDEIRENFADSVVLVTGAAGSIGSELCRQLAGFGVRKLVLFDNAETPMHNLRLELEEKFPELDFVPLIGDVRQPARLDYAFRKWRPKVVFHAAAYKHVPLMEENPCEATLVNVVGTRNVADMCLQYGARKMVMVSTDKAVNPTNVMGATKRLAEIYVQSLGLAIASGTVQGRTSFVTTRFGNVLGSNGSVIPRFREQIARGGPVTVTHPEITRYFMTIPEACRLVMEAATLSDGNDIFVFDMGKSVKIARLAQRMIELSGMVPDKDIKIVYTGLRPGEKLYEEVLASEENTTPTSHERIKIAQVREYDYDVAKDAVERLEVLSREVDIEGVVVLLKEIVTEYKSQNSVFERYDKEEGKKK